MDFVIERVKVEAKPRVLTYRKVVRRRGKRMVFRKPWVWSPQPMKIVTHHHPDLASDLERILMEQISAGS